MLQRVEHAHFEPLLGKVSPLYLPDGSELPVVIESTQLRPNSQLPESGRMPFSVVLRTIEPTLFVDGLCALDVPELGRLNEVFVSREPAMGRDAELGYFNIAFN
jgi:hypothetical protein